MSVMRRLVGTKVLVHGEYPATVVAYWPEQGGSLKPSGYVVAMTGENGTTPGEQFFVPREDFEVI